MRNGSKRIEIPFKSLYEHLLETPSHAHDTLQKVWGYVVKFTWLRRESTIEKILLTSMVVKKKVAF